MEIAIFLTKIYKYIYKTTEKIVFILHLKGKCQVQYKVNKMDKR
jgi:hypothetical protein